MTLQEAMKSGRPFKLPKFLNWVTIKKEEIYGDVFWYIRDRLILQPNEILSNEWIVKEETKWYDNIPEQGVLCWVRNNEDREIMDIIITFREGREYPFYSKKTAWMHARPVKEEEIISTIYKEI